MPGIDPQDYILFVTACECSRMSRAFPGWQPVPEIRVPLTFPARPVYDWVNAPTDDLMTTNIAIRTFRLQTQEVIGPNRRLFTYQEAP